MNESVTERVLLWMVSGLAGTDLENACIAKLNVPPERVKAVVAKARKQLTLAADYNRDEMLGTAMTRLNDLYARCIRQASGGDGPNLAKALDVQREINRLAGLYRGTGAGAVDEGAGAADSETAAELAAVREYLLPLGLADETYPVREHARLAVARIQELSRGRKE